MGRLGQIGSICTPCKILTLGTEIKNLAGGSFQHFIIKVSELLHQKINNWLFAWNLLKSSQMIWLNSLYTPNVVNIHKKIHPGMFIIFQPVPGFLTFYYLTHGVNKLGSPGVLGRWYLRSRQYKFLYLFICLFCLAQLPLLIIVSSLFSYLGDLSCGRETELHRVKIDTLRVSVGFLSNILVAGTGSATLKAAWVDWGGDI